MLMVAMTLAFVVGLRKRRSRPAGKSIITALRRKQSSSRAFVHCGRAKLGEREQAEGTLAVEVDHA
jgi:hypothetical protein